MNEQASNNNSGGGSKKGLIIGIIVAVVVIGAGALVFLNLDSIKEMLGMGGEIDDNTDDVALEKLDPSEYTDEVSGDIVCANGIYYAGYIIDMADGYTFDGDEVVSIDRFMRFRFGDQESYDKVEGVMEGADSTERMLNRTNTVLAETGVTGETTAGTMDNGNLYITDHYVFDLTEFSMDTTIYFTDGSTMSLMLPVTTNKDEILAAVAAQGFVCE